MLESRKHFRVYARGDMYYFATQAELGKWLMSAQADNQLGFATSAEDGTNRFYFLDDSLRIEHPSGKVADVGFLIECLYAAINVRHVEANAWRTRYRSGTFPGAKQNRGSYYRHMGTQGERRLNALIMTDEGEPAVRPARAPSALPTCWDDYARFNTRSWKNHRGAQRKHSTPSARIAWRDAVEEDDFE